MNAPDAGPAGSDGPSGSDGPDSGAGEGLAFVDGALCPVGEARISIFDWGFLRSDACQDTVSVWDGAFFRLDDHVDRFVRSSRLLRLELPYQRDELKGLLGRLVGASGLRRAYVQMIMTRGRGPAGNRDPRRCHNSFLAFCVPYLSVAGSGAEGLHVAVSHRHRLPPATVESEIKNYHWIDFDLGLLEAFDRGADTVLLTDSAGHLTEGPGFNLFLVERGALVTPAHNVLPGITRATVADLAAGAGLAVRYEDLAPARLAAADEAFGTSTAGGIVPVLTADGRPVGDGRPGPLTRRLRDLYWTRRAEGWHATPVTYLEAV